MNKSESEVNEREGWMAESGPSSSLAESESSHQWFNVKTCCSCG